MRINRRFILVLVVIVVIVVLVFVVLAKSPALAQHQDRYTHRLRQNQLRRFRRKRRDRIPKPDGQFWANPNHHVCASQAPRLGRAQRVIVRRGTGRQKNGGSIEPLHHPRDKRLDRSNIGHNSWRLGGARSGSKGKCTGKEESDH